MSQLWLLKLQVYSMTGEFWDFWHALKYDRGWLNGIVYLFTHNRWNACLKFHASELVKLRVIWRIWEWKNHGIDLNWGAFRLFSSGMAKSKHALFLHRSQLWPIFTLPLMWWFQPFWLLVQPFEYKTIDLGTHVRFQELLTKLDNVNKHILAIMTLGVDSSYGLAVIQKTVSLDLTKWLRFWNRSISQVMWALKLSWTRSLKKPSSTMLSTIATSWYHGMT